MKHTDPLNRTQLKISVFKHPRWRMAVILKTKTVRQIAMKFGMMTHFDPLKPIATVKISNFLKSKMADRRRFEKSLNRHS